MEPIKAADIVAIRQAFGWTRAELAFICGLDSSEIEQLEQRGARPRVHGQSLLILNLLRNRAAARPLGDDGLLQIGFETRVFILFSRWRSKCVAYLLERLEAKL